MISTPLALLGLCWISVLLLPPAINNLLDLLYEMEDYKNNGGNSDS
jgi:hypothetical protein